MSDKKSETTQEHSKPLDIFSQRVYEMCKQYGYTHLLFQAPTEDRLKQFFVDGVIPEVGDELKLVCAARENSDGIVTVAINLKVVKGGDV